MKRIAIFCDGTWNRLDAPDPTNVVKLAEAVSSRSDDGAVQVVWYDEGVGTSGAAVQRWLAGAFGHGLLDNVVRAYRFLAFNYDPGDEIFIFGYSRGAFTARSLAGLIRNCGIVRQADARRIGEAVTLYRNRDPAGHPDAEASLQFRARFCPEVYLSEKELAWRRQKGVGGDPTRLVVRYLGVWDTVGALGVPRHLLFSDLFNRRHRFHDCALSSSVSSARHAVAIDELRRTFEPALWENLAELAARNPEPDAYLQHWFPGDHGSVGGGGEIVGLSNAALLWVAEGAQAGGLSLNASGLAGFSADVDHRAPLRNSTRAAGLGGLLSRASREGPQTAADVSESARRRAREPAEDLPERSRYRPEPLARLGDGWWNRS